MMRLTDQALDNLYLRYLPQRTSHGYQPTVKKVKCGRLIRQIKGGMNIKLHAVTDNSGHPVHFFIMAGQVSDYTGPAALMVGIPEADWLLAPLI